MGRGKGRSYLPGAGDINSKDPILFGGSVRREAAMWNAGDDQEGAANDIDMTDSNGDLTLDETIRPIDTSMSSAKTVQGTSMQTPDITTEQEPSVLQADMGNDISDYQQWHQVPPDAIRDSEELWQPPQPVSSKTTIKSAQKYRKFCDEIEARWSCTISEAMPLHLRASTPYSLTMLLHLHRLAALSRKDMVGAHAALDVARSSRLSGAVLPSGEAQIEWTDNTKSTQERVQKYAEPRIWENTNGLMLVDVRKACRSVNEAKRGEKKAAAEDAMDVTRDRSKKAEKRARYKANKAAKKHEAQLQGSGRVEKSRANARSQLRLTGKGIKNQIEDAGDLEPRKGGRWGGNKSDKKDNRQFVRAFESLGEDKKSEVSESKRKAVARGFKLPSERFNPASLGSLGSAAQGPGEDGVGSNGGEMDLLE